MKLMKWNEKSKGVGDTIKKITSATKLDKLAEKIAEVAGKEDCGCKKRQDRLNRMFPYQKENYDNRSKRFPLRGKDD